MKYFVVERHDDKSRHVIGVMKGVPSGPDYKVICPSPVDNKIGISVLDLVDDIDELSGEIIGKKAVINQAKLAAYEQAKATAEQARQDAQNIKNLRRQELKTGLLNFDVLPDSQKWALLKKTIQELVGE